MKFRIILAVLAVAILGGCAGSKTPVAPANARGAVADLPSKTFEISRVQLTVAPNPPAQSQKMFNDLSGNFMYAVSDMYFNEWLGKLLARDLGAKLDYSKLRSTPNYKNSKKAGFVWDPNLYALQATKKIKTGDQTIEITSTVPNPTISHIETVITVANDGDIIKEYRISADVSAQVPDNLYSKRVFEYFTHIPELISLGVGGMVIRDESIDEWIASFKEMVERFRLEKNLPEEDLKRIREMVTDVDPSSGIVIEDLMSPESEPAKQEEGGSGATLMD